MKRNFAFILIFTLLLSGCSMQNSNNEKKYKRDFYYNVFENDNYVVLRSETTQPGILIDKKTNDEYEDQFEFFCLIGDNILLSIYDKEYRFNQGFFYLDGATRKTTRSDSVYSFVSPKTLKTANWTEVKEYHIFNGVIKENEYSRESIQMMRTANPIRLNGNVDTGLYFLLDAIYSSKSFNDKYGSDTYLKKEDVKLLESNSESLSAIEKYEKYELSIHGDMYFAEINLTFPFRWKVQEFRKINQ